MSHPRVAHRAPVAVGFRCHSGWAFMVVVAGSLRAPEVLDRQRIELVGSSLPRQPYHAVAEQGAPRSVIERVGDESARKAAAAVAAVSGVAAVGLVAAERRLPDDLDQILRAHSWLHSAEGRLYEMAVIEGAAAAGLHPLVVAPDSVAVSPEVEGLRASIGSPWQKDHKLAAAVALAALAARPRARAR